MSLFISIVLPLFYFVKYTKVPVGKLILNLARTKPFWINLLISGLLNAQLRKISHAKSTLCLLNIRTAKCSTSNIKIANVILCGCCPEFVLASLEKVDTKPNMYSCQALDLQSSHLSCPNPHPSMNRTTELEGPTMGKITDEALLFLLYGQQKLENMHKKEEEQEKNLADAIRHPRAMVVKLLNTTITGRTVLSTKWPNYLLRH